MDPNTNTMPEARYRTTNKVRQASATATRRPEPVLAPGTQKVPAVSKSKAKKPGEAVAAWWPVAVGIFLCGFVPEWHQDVVAMGVWAERLLFPLTLLAQHREIGISEHMASTLPKIALYLQLPLEGLLTKLTLDRGKGLKAAAMQLVLLHGLCALVLWLLTFLH